MPALGATGAVTFTTDGLRAADHVEAWRATTGRHLDFEPLGPGGLPGWREAWMAGDALVLRLSRAAVRIRRPADRVRRDWLDHWFIGLSPHAEVRLLVAGEARRIPPGRPFLVGLHQPYETEGWDRSALGLFLPRDALPAPLNAALEAHPDAATTGPGATLLAGFLRMAVAALPELGAAGAPRLQPMAVAALALAMDTPAAPPPPDEALRVAQLRAVVRRHLGAAQLGPAHLARLTGLSRSRLYRLLDSEGGVARFIQAERLRQARRRLADPTDPAGMGEIAADCGFFHGSSFSRAFRAAYGLTPTEARRAALAGRAAAHARPRDATLEALLRTLAG